MSADTARVAGGSKIICPTQGCLRITKKQVGQHPCSRRWKNRIISISCRFASRLARFIQKKKKRNNIMTKSLKVFQTLLFALVILSLAACGAQPTEPAVPADATEAS